MKLKSREGIVDLAHTAIYSTLVRVLKGSPPPPPTPPPDLMSRPCDVAYHCDILRFTQVWLCFIVHRCPLSL